MIGVAVNVYRAARQLDSRRPVSGSVTRDAERHRRLTPGRAMTLESPEGNGGADCATIEETALASVRDSRARSACAIAIDESSATGL